MSTEAQPQLTNSRSWQLQQRLAPYFFVSPFLLLFCIFLIYPLARSLMLSTYKTAGPNVQKFNGIGNYAFLLRDRIFWYATLNTVAYTIAYLLLQIPLSLGLAMLVNRSSLRGRNFYRFAFFTPNLVGSVFLGVLFAVFLNSKNGPVNELLRSLGVSNPPNWLNDPNLAMVSVLIASLWVSVGFGMMYCLAALQNVDRELYEAADVDGAGKWSKFLHITLPGVRPVLAFLVLVGTIGSLQLFELPFVLFNGPGPNSRAITIVMYLFSVGFEQGDLGYAATIGWALVILVAAVGYIGARFATRGGSR